MTFTSHIYIAYVTNCIVCRLMHMTTWLIHITYMTWHEYDAYISLTWRDCIVCRRICTWLHDSSISHVWHDMNMTHMYRVCDMIALYVDAYAHKYMTHPYGMYDMIDLYDAYISHMWHDFNKFRSQTHPFHMYDMTDIHDAYMSHMWHDGIVCRLISICM